MRRQRAAAAGLLGLAAIAAAAIVLSNTGGSAHRGGAPGARATKAAGKPGSAGARPVAPSPSAVGYTVLHLVDSTRTVELPSGPAPRTLTTIVRYPALGGAAHGDTPGAAPAVAQGPYPLIVFGHGFAVTPALYAPLLQAWARAGYVVAAPVFPLENANAPGGPNESDLSNQPQDMRFVISELLAASARGSGPLAGLIDPREIAVAGQSDGGDTALAVAYDERLRDPRVKAAVILSGAELPGIEGWAFAPGEPPLLATQGTADTVNPPAQTNEFFAAAATPKYLLSLPGAEHLPPYSKPGPQLTAVENVTTAFLDGYLGHDSSRLARLQALGDVPGVASLTAEP